MPGLRRRQILNEKPRRQAKLGREAMLASKQD
jgi:hypothetical protein